MAGRWIHPSNWKDCFTSHAVVQLRWLSSSPKQHFMHQSPRIPHVLKLALLNRLLILTHLSSKQGITICCASAVRWRSFEKNISHTSSEMQPAKWEDISVFRNKHGFMFKSHSQYLQDHFKLYLLIYLFVYRLMESFLRQGLVISQAGLEFTV